MQALPVVEPIDVVLDGHTATVHIEWAPVEETVDPLGTKVCTLSSESVEIAIPDKGTSRRPRELAFYIWYG
jgi:hypothetical protein